MTTFIGLDFGTTRARGVLLEIVDGGTSTASSSSRKRTVRLAGEIAIPYASGILEESSTNAVLQRDPDDWFDAGKRIVSRFREEIGRTTPITIGIAFTSCTVLPVDASGEALCANLAAFPNCTPENRPHLYPKVWKHHSEGVQRVADELAAVLRDDANDAAWLERFYGGNVGLEYFIPKVVEVYDCDREVFNAAHTFIEAGDWLAYKLSRWLEDEETREKRARHDVPVVNIPRSTCQAGYKNFYDVETGKHRVTAAHLTRLRPSLAPRDVEKIIDARAPYLAPGSRLGGGNRALSSVSAIDAHAAAYAMGCAKRGTMVAVMGTSGCMMLCVDRLPAHDVRGMCGAIKDGIAPDSIGVETGLSAVGDLFGFLSRFTNRSLQELEEEAVLELNTKNKTKRKKCWAIDHFNGSRTPFMRGDLTGSFRDLTLRTSPGEVFLCLCESVAFALRLILEMLRGDEASKKQGMTIDCIVFGGGVVSSSLAMRSILRRALRGEVLKESEIPAVATAIGAGLLAMNAVRSEVNDLEDLVRSFVEGRIAELGGGEDVRGEVEEEEEEEDWGSEMRYQRYKRVVLESVV